jgi:hypothetical protein
VVDRVREEMTTHLELEEIRWLAPT